MSGARAVRDRLSIVYKNVIIVYARARVGRSVSGAMRLPNSRHTIRSQSHDVPMMERHGDERRELFLAISPSIACAKSAAAAKVKMLRNPGASHCIRIF